MLCLGTAQQSPLPLESESAQLRMVQLFRADFLKRFPSGVVISELEYMGRNTSAPSDPGSLQYPGRPKLNKVMQALSVDFRRWSKERDYRKCDALGISGDATRAELVEVTTAKNMASAVGQMAGKLSILRETVNRIHNMSVDWRPSAWRPGSADLFYALPPGSVGEIRYLCYVPTSRVPAPPGVILYEVHVVRKPQVPVQVPLSKDVADQLRDGFKSKKQQVNSEAWARQFLAEHPVVGTALRALALACGAALLVAAVILVFDPVPGDEVAAAGAAIWLVKLATS